MQQQLTEDFDCLVKSYQKENEAYCEKIKHFNLSLSENFYCKRALTNNLNTKSYPNGINFELSFLLPILMDKNKLNIISLRLDNRFRSLDKFNENVLVKKHGEIKLSISIDNLELNNEKLLNKIIKENYKPYAKSNFENLNTLFNKFFNLENNFYCLGKIKGGLFSLAAPDAKVFITKDHFYSLDNKMKKEINNQENLELVQLVNYMNKELASKHLDKILHNKNVSNIKIKI